MHRDPKGFYSLFSVTPDATATEIQDAFDKKVGQLNLLELDYKEFNPLLNILEEAYSTLIDGSSRKLYDRHWGHFNTRNYSKSVA